MLEVTLSLGQHSDKQWVYYQCCVQVRAGGRYFVLGRDLIGCTVRVKHLLSLPENVPFGGHKYCCHWELRSQYFSTTHSKQRNFAVLTWTAE